MPIAEIDQPLQGVEDAEIVPVAVRDLRVSCQSIEIYGDPNEMDLESDGLLESVQASGILVPLVACPEVDGSFVVVSGHRRLACASRLGLELVPCIIREIPRGNARLAAIIEYNQQRQKTFSQRMREADVLERLWTSRSRERRGASHARDKTRGLGCLESDTSAVRPGQVVRSDQVLARAIGIRSKDTYRQARCVWRMAQEGDARALAGVGGLDAGTKSIHGAYKDLRRRDRFSSGFRPNPYDVWSFRHDAAFGIPHPGAIPAGIVAHAVHYFSPPGGLVVDPMAGGGTTLDVCLGMGRRCLAYDLHPSRPEIRSNDVLQGLPLECGDCDLFFCDPPYHTMRAGEYGGPGVGEGLLADWIAFLQHLSQIAFLQVREGGHVAILLANQTEKDLPAGLCYIDHVLLGFNALCRAGFQPVRRISCPMSGGYRPHQVRQARDEGRLLGLVRDLIVMRKPFPGQIVPSIDGKHGLSDQGRGSPQASS